MPMRIWETDCRHMSAMDNACGVCADKRIAELEAGIREYLAEYDTPAKDFAYRAACREKLRKLVAR